MGYLKVTVEKDALKNGMMLLSEISANSNKMINHRDVVIFKVLLKKLLHRRTVGSKTALFQKLHLQQTPAHFIQHV